MSLFNRIYTFTDGTTAYGSQVETEIANIVLGLNNLNTASTNWGQVSILNATSVPLIADCSAGSQHIADFKNNSVIKASVSSDGRVQVADGTAIGDAISFGQHQPSIPNILDNGGFEGYGWQRATTFSAPASLTYGADRWKFVTDEAANVTVTKETTTIDSVGLASMKVVVASAGASHFWQVSQNVENYADYRGKTIMFSARLFSSVAGTLSLSVSDGVVGTQSSYHSGGGGWETITMIKTMSASASSFGMSIGMLNSGDKKNGTYYFDSAMVCVSSAASAFVPTNPKLDYERCRWFYRILKGAVNDFVPEIGTGQCYNTTHVEFILSYPAMRTTPTITINNPTHLSTTKNDASSQALTAFAVNSTGASSAQLLATVAAGLTAGDASQLLITNTDATIEISADL